VIDIEVRGIDMLVIDSPEHFAAVEGAMIRMTIRLIKDAHVKVSTHPGIILAALGNLEKSWLGDYEGLSRNRTTTKQSCVYTT
jgi:hypothetical protein